jgi:hypothetical protein
MDILLLILRSYSRNSTVPKLVIFFSITGGSSHECPCLKCCLVEEDVMFVLEIRARESRCVLTFKQPLRCRSERMGWSPTTSSALLTAKWNPSDARMDISASTVPQLRSKSTMSGDFEFDPLARLCFLPLLLEEKYFNRPWIKGVMRLLDGTFIIFIAR